MKYLPTILVTIIIFVLVLWPGSKLPQTQLPVDKLVHFLLFATWAVAARNDFNWKWFVVLSAGLAVALCSELVQLATKDRSFDTMDLLADSAGLVFGLANADFAIRIVKKLLRR